MFLYKKIVALLNIVISLTILSSCNTKGAAAEHIATDTSKINFWKRNYDTLFNQYRHSKDIRFIREAGPYADSLLQIDKQILADTGYRKIYMSVLFSRAAGLNVLEDFIKSQELFEQYLYLFREYNFEKSIYLAYAQKTVGNIYSRYGDYKKAVLQLGESLKYSFAVKDTLEISSGIINISIPLKELGNYEEAIQTLQKIFQLPSAEPKRKATACIELADIYSRLHNTTEAGLKIREAGQFLDLVTQDDSRTETFRTLCNIEGNWFMANNNPAEAVRAYQKSIDSAKISKRQNLRNREIGKTYIAMGKAMEQLTYFDSALRFYNKALYTVANIDTLNNLSLPLQMDLYAENTIAEALFARASCLASHSKEDMKKLENAVNCYHLAFETEKKLLTAFSYDESRLYMLEETRKQTGEAIALCYELYEKTKDTRWAKEAFLFAESNKSFVLNESIRRNIAASLFIREDPSYKQVQLLKGRVASVEIELNMQKMASTPDTALQAKLMTDKQKLEEVLLQNENTLKIKNPQYTNWLNNERSLSAEEITSSMLARGSAMVEYFVDDSVVYMFSAAKDKQLSFAKLPAGVKESCSHFLSFFSDRNMILNKPAEYAAAANHLYDLLSAPENNEGSASLIIIPDGFISLVPFDALLTSNVTSTNISSFPFLIKRSEISYAFSGSTILMQQQSKVRSGDDQLIAFAPVFKNRERGFSPLLNSTGELEAIREFYTTGKYFNNADASLQKFKALCSNASVIHLATHANAGSDSSIAGIEFFDTTLYLNDIYTLPLQARLVVLSGCETGAGAVNKTEGLMSLARGFSYAGTQNVVAGLWQTEDKTSGQIFKNFYSALSDNTISGSLRDAKLKLIENASVSQASPFYWAGYICIGIPGEKISGGKTEDRFFIFIAALLLLAGAFMIIKNRRSI